MFEEAVDPAAAPAPAPARAPFKVPEFEAELAGILRLDIRKYGTRKCKANGKA